MSFVVGDRVRLYFAAEHYTWLSTPYETGERGTVCGPIRTNFLNVQMDKDGGRVSGWHISHLIRLSPLEQLAEVTE